MNKNCNTEPFRLEHVYSENNAKFKELSYMLWQYILELNKIEPNVTERSQEALEEEYFFCPGTEYILLMCGNDCAGFAIIGRGVNCHPDADMYIEEFYIRPEYRNKGCGHTFAKMLLDGVQAVCFIVLKKTAKAEKMWKEVFSDWKDVSIQIPDVIPTEEWCNWYVYRRMEK